MCFSVRCCQCILTLLDRRCSCLGRRGITEYYVQCLACSGGKPYRVDSAYKEYYWTDQNDVEFGTLHRSSNARYPIGAPYERKPNREEEEEEEELGVPGFFFHGYVNGQIKPLFVTRNDLLKYLDDNGRQLEKDAFEETLEKTIADSKKTADIVLNYTRQLKGLLRIHNTRCERQRNRIKEKQSSCTEEDKNGEE